MISIRFKLKFHKDNIKSFKFLSLMGVMHSYVYKLPAQDKLASLYNLFLKLTLDSVPCLMSYDDISLRIIFTMMTYTLRVFIMLKKDLRALSKAYFFLFDRKCTLLIF